MTARKQGYKAGSTLVMAMIHEGAFTVGHIGDSVALLLKQNSKVTRLTEAQVPSRTDEYNRIVQSNGLITMKDGVARVDGSLAVSRAIGDAKYKEFLISEPEVVTTQLQPTDDILILSSDGLFMVYSEDQVCQMIAELRAQG